jgi:hypothetical protein
LARLPRPAAVAHDAASNCKMSPAFLHALFVERFDAPHERFDAPCGAMCCPISWWTFTHVAVVVSVTQLHDVELVQTDLVACLLPRLEGAVDLLVRTFTAGLPSSHLGCSTACQHHIYSLLAPCSCMVATLHLHMPQRAHSAMAYIIMQACHTSDRLSLWTRAALAAATRCMCPQSARVKVMNEGCPSAC